MRYGPTACLEDILFSCLCHVLSARVWLACRTRLSHSAARTDGLKPLNPCGPDVGLLRRTAAVSKTACSSSGVSIFAVSYALTRLLNVWPLKLALST